MESSSSNSKKRRINRVGGIEENVLAILDVTDSKHTQDSNDDRIAFLQAVRASCIVSENATPPTDKMCEAVFGIMRVGQSLELIMESYSLLIELDKHFPRVRILDRGGSSKSSELSVDEEAWSPFVFNLDVASGEREAVGKGFVGRLDSLGFYLLIEELSKVANEANYQASETKSLGNMLLFQYLVNVLDADLVPRSRVYEETSDWIILRESLLSMLLNSRRINYKSLMKDCLSIMCGLHQVSAGISDEVESANIAAALALIEVGYNTCSAMKKLLTMIMELDTLRKKADMQGCTTRADGVRTPLVEIILDELTYDREMLPSFLQIFNEPKWKLEVILQYFSKYTAKPSVRTRRSNGCAEDATFNGTLKCFANSTSTRNITKKISADVVQLLLAHAFQAHLSLSSSQQDAAVISDSKDDVRGSYLAETCKNLISAFNSLRRTDEKMEILSFGKEALFTAATILSSKL